MSVLLAGPNSKSTVVCWCCIPRCVALWNPCLSGLWLESEQLVQGRLLAECPLQESFAKQKDKGLAIHVSAIERSCVSIVFMFFRYCFTCAEWLHRRTYDRASPASHRAWAVADPGYMAPSQRWALKTQTWANQGGIHLLGIRDVYIVSDFSYLFILFSMFVINDVHRESPANLELLGLLLCQALAANSACMMGAFQANAEGCVVAGTSEGEQQLQCFCMFC